MKPLPAYIPVTYTNGLWHADLVEHRPFVRKLRQEAGLGKTDPHGPEAYDKLLSAASKHGHGLETALGLSRGKPARRPPVKPRGKSKPTLLVTFNSSRSMVHHADLLGGPYPVIAYARIRNRAETWTIYLDRKGEECRVYLSRPGEIDDLVCLSHPDIMAGSLLWDLATKYEVRLVSFLPSLS